MQRHKGGCQQRPHFTAINHVLRLANRDMPPHFPAIELSRPPTLVFVV